MTINYPQSRNILNNKPDTLALTWDAFFQSLLASVNANVSAATVSNVNFLRNAAFDIWQRGTSITVTTAGGYTADGWIVTPTGASVTVTQAAGRALSVNSIKITGATSVTDATLAQRIESYIAAQLTSQVVTYQAWVYNNTGGSITPKLTVQHPTVQDNYTGVVTDVSAVSLLPCANAAWTQVGYTFTASASSALGIQCTLDFGNNLSSGAKFVQVAESALSLTPAMTAGIAYAMPSVPFKLITEELAVSKRYFQSTYGNGVAPATATRNGLIGGVTIVGASYFALGFSYPAVLRINPTSFSTWDGAGNVSKTSSYNGTAWTDNAAAIVVIANSSTGLVFYNGNTGVVLFHYNVSAEL